MTKKETGNPVKYYVILIPERMYSGKKTFEKLTEIICSRLNSTKDT